MPVLLLSTLTPLLPFSSVYLILFLLFPCASVWENTRARSPFPIAILNGTCVFPTAQLQVHNVDSERKNRNSCALVNLYL